MLWQVYLAEDGQNRRKFAQDIEIIEEKFLKERPLENQPILPKPPLEKDSKGTYLPYK